MKLLWITIALIASTAEAHCPWPGCTTQPPTPWVTTPDVTTTPTVTPPNVTTPGVTTPTVTAPNVTAPNATTPTLPITTTPTPWPTTKNPCAPENGGCTGPVGTENGYCIFRILGIIIPLTLTICKPNCGLLGLSGSLLGLCTDRSQCCLLQTV